MKKQSEWDRMSKREKYWRLLYLKVILAGVVPTGLVWISLEYYFDGRYHLLPMFVWLTFVVLWTLVSLKIANKIGKYKD